VSQRPDFQDISDPSGAGLAPLAAPDKRFAGFTRRSPPGIRL